MFSMGGWRKRLLVCVVIALVVFGCVRVYYRMTDDIRLSNMQYEVPFHKEWEIPPLSPLEQTRLNAILDQPFHYIGKGAQSYAFASQDNRYVLKFFKFKHLKPSWFVDLLPNVYPFKNYKETQSARKQKKLEGVFEGYRLAYQVHKEDSGIIYIHLNPSDNLHKTVVIKDKLGFTRHVDLDKFVFILQEKARTTRNVMKDLLNAGDTETAKVRIRQIFDLYVSEYQKGIYDRDHGVMHNTGFVNTKPIHLDVGKLTDAPMMKDPKIAEEDLEKIAYKFHTWLHSNYPKYAAEMDKDMEMKLSEIFGHPWSFNH